MYDVQPGESIAHDFIKKYKPLAESQIAKAGYRLAAVLNDVFGK
ncbi:S1/P1 nuclease [Alistipes putredinis]